MRALFSTSQFQKDIRRIPFEVRERLEEIVGRLRNNPLDRSLSPIKLHSVTPPTWRVRIGAFRLVYTFNTQSVFLHRIRHRKDVYRKW